MFLLYLHKVEEWSAWTCHAKSLISRLNLLSEHAEGSFAKVAGVLQIEALSCYNANRSVPRVLGTGRICDCYKPV